MLRRALRVVPGLLVWVLFAAALPAPPARAEIPASAETVKSAGLASVALPPGITREQLEEALQAIQAGSPLPPEFRKALEENPGLMERFPPEIREKLEQAQEQGEPDAVKQEAAPQAPPQEQTALSPYDWRASVYVAGLFSDRLRKSEVRALGHFGHEIFDPRPGGAAILENMPAAPGYLIGPGDEVVVRLWGRMEGTHRMVVDRDGKIFFPKIGSLYVAGKTFDELRSFLQAKVGSIAQVSSDVSLGRMKGVRVSVVGEVRAPGWYNVSSLHTVLQVLGLAGGVKDIGSLRRIELRRGGKTAERIDLYEILLSGDTGNDMRLLQGDAVFVPVVGKLVALTGEVRRPAIYEMKDEKTLLELVRMGGGFAPTAYKRRVQVERLEGHFARVVLDVDAEELEKNGSSFPLSDGDIVRVLPIALADTNTVTLEGNVVRPGRYERKPGMTVGDLLPDERSFLPDTYFDYAELTRLTPPDMSKETIPVNLRAIVLEKRKEADVLLAAYDNLVVFHRKAFRDAPRATVSGEVRRPGTFELKGGVRVSDLVKLAGDLTRNASREEAELSRYDEQRNPTFVKVDLGKALAGDASANLPVRDGDVLFVRRISGLQEVRYVTVTGEVQSPGVFTVLKGDRLSSVLERAGGFTADAYLKAAQFTRASTQKTQQEAIDKLIEDLEVEVTQKAQEVSAAIDREDIEANRMLLEARRTLIAQLKKAKAKGRVVIRLADPQRLKGTPSDILLEDGDRLEIPKKTDVVNVVGRVYNPTGVQYDPVNDRLEYYLQRVGGPTESADREHIFLVKADGSVVTQENVGGGFLSGGLMSARVEPGDSIVVPERLIRPRLMKEIKDFTQILYQIAVTAGVLFVAF